MYPSSIAIPIKILVTDFPTDWDVTKLVSSLTTKYEPKAWMVVGRLSISFWVIPLKSERSISPFS